MTEVTLKKLSVCPCGFPALDESIPLGTAYRIDEEDSTAFTWSCGGCKAVRSIVAVWVYERGPKRAGYLPSELFLMPERKEATPD